MLGVVHSGGVFMNVNEGMKRHLIDCTVEEIQTDRLKSVPKRHAIYRSMPTGRS